MDLWAPGLAVISTFLHLQGPAGEQGPRGDRGDKGEKVSRKTILPDPCGFLQSSKAPYVPGHHLKGSPWTGGSCINFAAHWCLFLFLQRVPLDLVAEMESLGPLEILAPLALLAPLGPLALVE